jgi:hypothetical protein
MGGSRSEDEAARTIGVEASGGSVTPDGVALGDSSGADSPVGLLLAETDGAGEVGLCSGKAAVVVGNAGVPGAKICESLVAAEDRPDRIPRKALERIVFTAGHRWRGR